MRAPQTTEPRFDASSTDLQTVLAAWQDAISRLEKTHLILQEEVGRLNVELEVKNRELARKNRLADLGQVASHVAHEVRNNLAPLTLYLGLLKRRLTEDATSLEMLNKVMLSVGDMDALVNDLLHFTADREPNLRPTALRPFLLDALDRLAPQLSAYGINVDVHVHEDLQLPLDADMFRRVVLNLLINAIDVMPGGGRIEIAATCRDDTCTLQVKDNGPGISVEVLPRLFEPFFSTKGSGAGLGLAIAGHVVERHGGTLVACNRPASEGQGASFEVGLPLVAAARAIGPVSASANEAHQATAAA